MTTTMKIHKGFLGLSLFCYTLMLCGCQQNDSTEGRGRLKVVVLYYKYIAFNREKTKAAEFIIDNMKTNPFLCCENDERHNKK